MTMSFLERHLIMVDTITRNLLQLLNELLLAKVEPHIIVDTLLMKVEILLPGLSQNDYVTIIRTIIEQIDSCGYFVSIIKDHPKSKTTSNSSWKESDRAYHAVVGHR